MCLGISIVWAKAQLRTVGDWAKAQLRTVGGADEGQV